MRDRQDARDGTKSSDDCHVSDMEEKATGKPLVDFPAAERSPPTKDYQLWYNAI